jgi:hypothetical protein
MSIARPSSMAGALANPVGDLLSYHQAVAHEDDGDGQHRDDDHHGKGPREGPRGCRTRVFVSGRLRTRLRLTTSP